MQAGGLVVVDVGVPVEVGLDDGQEGVGEGVGGVGGEGGVEGAGEVF